jgi:hypothetical protein
MTRSAHARKLQFSSLEEAHGGNAYTNDLALLKKVRCHCLREAEFPQDRRHTSSIRGADGDPDVEIRSGAGVAVVVDAYPPITRYRTLFEFSNLKNSLKSGGSWIVAIENLTHQLKRFHALLRRFPVAVFPNAGAFLKIVDPEGRAVQTNRVRAHEVILSPFHPLQPAC